MLSIIVVSAEIQIQTIWQKIVKMGQDYVMEPKLSMFNLFSKMD